MTEPHTTNGAGESLHHTRREFANSRERRLRKYRRIFRTPRVLFEARCTDADSLLDRVSDLTEGLRGLWQGVMTIKKHEDRAAAIAGARSFMIEIELYMEQVSREINRTEEASAKLGTSSRRAMSRFGHVQTRHRKLAEEGGL